MKKFFKIGCGTILLIFISFYVLNRIAVSNLTEEEVEKQELFKEYYGGVYEYDENGKQLTKFDLDSLTDQARDSIYEKRYGDIVKKYREAKEREIWIEERDLNNDGIVSEEEELQYEEKIKQEKIELERKRKEEYNKCNSTDIAKIKSKYNYVLDVLVIDYRIYLVERVGANGNRLTITVNYSNKPDCF